MVVSVDLLSRLKNKFSPVLYRDCLKACSLFLLFASTVAGIWWLPAAGRWGEILPIARRLELMATLALFYGWRLLLVNWAILYHYWRLGRGRDRATYQALCDLKQRFLSALCFLRKTTITKQSAMIHLIEQPWYFCIGPAKSGKTTLLLNSKVHFILQKQFNQFDIQHVTPTKNCEWWVTRDHTILDVPSSYMDPSSVAARPQTASGILWQALLHLVKCYRKRGLQGILVMLPLPEMLLQHDVKYYDVLLTQLVGQLQAVTMLFKQDIACYLVVTKCDLLPGFTAFFSESGSDELAQTLGVPLTVGTHQQGTGDAIHDIFTKHIEVLIKRLNEQLLWRLHQEHHYLVRSCIKDFPLQMERLKHFTIEVIKQLSSLQGKKIVWQGVYFTSAIQPPPDTGNVILPDGTLDVTHSTLPILCAPSCVPRPHFIKQLITQAIAEQHVHYVVSRHSPFSEKWQRFFAYMLFFGVMGAVGFAVGKDLQQGLYRLYLVQHALQYYRSKTQLTITTAKHLHSIVILLNSLSENSDDRGEQSIFSFFYSSLAEQEAKIVYQQALQTMLLPEIKNMLEDFLRLPQRKNLSAVYAAFRAYLMLGDTTRFRPDAIISIVKKITTSKLSILEQRALINHLRLALGQYKHALPLNTDFIESIRGFLSAKSNVELGYAVLMNVITPADPLVLHISYPLVFSRDRAHIALAVFTADRFREVLDKKINLAAKAVIFGNWVLGHDRESAGNTRLATELATQLTQRYVTQYAHYWESLLKDILLVRPADLAESDKFILRLIGNTSPLLQVLQLAYHHTHFLPITNQSNMLQHLNTLFIINDSRAMAENMLYQAFANLQRVHLVLQNMLVAKRKDRAVLATVLQMLRSHQSAFAALSHSAQKVPSPLREWLLALNNTMLIYLDRQVLSILDEMWQKRVFAFYRHHLAAYYPFNNYSRYVVDQRYFTDFFADHGLLVTFYKNYLRYFVDQTSQGWRWQTLSPRVRLALSDEVLLQVKQALYVNQIFFHNRQHNTSTLHGYVAQALSTRRSYFIKPDMHVAVLNQAIWPINERKIIFSHYANLTRKIYNLPTMISLHYFKLSKEIVNDHY